MLNAVLSLPAVAGEDSCSRMERAGKPRHRWATREGERAGASESTLSEFTFDPNFDSRQEARVSEVRTSLKELSSAIYDFVFSSLGQFSRSVIILLLAAGVMVGAHGNNEIPGSPS